MTENKDIKPRVVMIAAVGENGELGRDGDLIWHIRGDLQHFKTLTMGSPVIMGRRTWESLPKGALPGRRNIVITRNADYPLPGAERASSPAEAVAMCEGAEKVFVIGGGRIYADMMPLSDTLELTRVYASYPDADTFFPEVDDATWETVAESELMDNPDGLKYRFITLIRK